MPDPAPSIPRPVSISSVLGVTRGIQRGPRPSNTRRDMQLFPRPHLAVFAGVHGNEIASRLAAAILAQAARVVGPRSDEDKSRSPKCSDGRVEIVGTLTVFPNANPAGCIAGMRYAPQWSGGDDHDLNRAFGPQHDAFSGRPGGSPERQHAEEISAWIEATQPSLILDMHEGITPAEDPAWTPTPLWYAVDLSPGTDDALVPSSVAGIVPAVWHHSQRNSLTGHGSGDLKVPALVQETDHEAMDLRARIELHLAGAVVCAASIGLTIEVDRSQVEFMLRTLAPIVAPSPASPSPTRPDPPTS